MNPETPEPITPPHPEPSPASPPVAGEVVVHWVGAGRKPWLTYALMALMGAAYVAQIATLQPDGSNLIFAFAAKDNAQLSAGQFWRLLTPTFLHLSILHLVFSLYGVYVLGKTLEKHYGPRGLLTLFLLSALGGNTASFLFSTRPSVGAATALFGMLAALIVLVDRNRFFFGDRAGRILTQMVLLVVLNLALSLVPGFDSLGVVGGLAAGLLYALIAGPVWNVMPREDGFHLLDRTPRHRRIVGGAALALIFVLAALTRIG